MEYAKYMSKAIELALKGLFKTEPNPMVGAVLVNSKGDILGEGYHEKAGMPHAEVKALESLEFAPPGAILFVTLEPCCHFGKTPPCTELIIAKQVKTVVVGTLDPNPLVAGKGVERLRQSGLEVVYGICEKECREINAVFNKHITSELPFVSIKAAATLDGKIAMASGESKWITGEQARAEGHFLRSRHQAIAVGANTLRMDNPRLNDRVSIQPRDPVKVLFSSNGEVPVTSYFFRDTEHKRFVFVGQHCSQENIRILNDANINVFVSEKEVPSPSWALSVLYRNGICSLLVEGGGKLIASMIREDLVDRLFLFLSGKIIGDAKAPAWCEGLGIAQLSDVPHVRISDTKKLGEDILLVADFKKTF